MEQPPLLDKVEHALTQLERARPFNKARYQTAMLELSSRLLDKEGGIETLYHLAPRFDMAGVFAGTDWDNPTILVPNLVRTTFEHGEKHTITLELLSELRLLALSRQVYSHPGVPAEQARHFLTQVLALNLNQVFGTLDESQRIRLGKTAEHVRRVFRFLLDNIGFEDILTSLIDEIWRILSQRPIQVESVKSMITQIAITASQESNRLGDASLGADRLVSALFGPTQHCQDDPGLEVYASRLSAMDKNALQQEAYGFARAMRDVGLVSDYHTVLIRWLLDHDRDALVSDALGLSSTGLDVMRSYQQLVRRLLDELVRPETAQSIYSLAMMLESGILYSPPIAPALWRQLDLPLSDYCCELLRMGFGQDDPPQRRLLAGTIAILGQPLGIGQGNNPTCQSARAISMWAYNDPDYLLHLIARAARYDSITMHFEGQAIGSANIPMANHPPLDTDPVSMVLVPHLDRIYHEMGRLCADRQDDPHRWINPEFHGWWVGREFFLAVDIATGKLKDYDAFVTRFYRSYHPLYNGNQPIIHPQPAGLAVTDSSANFVGWHAISLIRVALDQDGVMRIYFFNPNNDSGQNWGNGVHVSTQGYGERYGEASIPFTQMASRIYIFHDISDDAAYHENVAISDLEDVKQMACESWARERLDDQELAAQASS